MLLKLSKWLIIVGVLALTGQTLAAAVASCETMGEAKKEAMAADHKDCHGKMSRSAADAVASVENASPKADEDCCQLGTCLMASCVLTGFLPSTPAKADSSISSDSTIFNGPYIAAAFTASLYRPPIPR